MGWRMKNFSILGVQEKNLSFRGEGSWKTNIQGGGLHKGGGGLNKCLRGSSFHVKPVFFFNIFSKDLYFYALITGLF